MASNDIEELGRLIAALPPMPVGWVRAAQAEALSVRLLRLAEEDADALAAARAAFPNAEPEASDPRRDFAFGKVLDRAAAIPLAIAEACADVAVLARAVAERVDPAHGP